MLAREPIDVRLAFSLNATTDEVRSRIMPVNKKYPFRTVLEAIREYQQSKGEPVTLEYVLLSGVNDTPADAERLARFARSLQCKVNLIAYNPHPAPTHSFGSRIESSVRMFPIAERVTITVRWSKGRDIQAACGQLATTQRARKSTSLEAGGGVDRAPETAPPL
jgi:23S rRNA (adenine2503-C2)-methyltransferase